MIHLTRAYLCPDCSTIGSNATHCPACGNRCGLLNLSSVLDRDPVREEVSAIVRSWREVLSERIFA